MDTVSVPDRPMQLRNEGAAGRDVTRHISPAEYVAVISMTMASIYLLLTSFFPLIYNLASSFEPLDFLKNLFYFIIGLGTLAGASFLLRKETYLERVADETFDRVIYHRLEPVLRDVAEVQVGLAEVQNQLEMVNMNLETLSKKSAPAVQGATNQTAYHTKYIVLINITLAVFLFMLQYPLGYIPYAVTILYIIWWVMITAEYRLWSLDIVWIWVFAPILVLPIYTIVLNTYLPDYQLFSSLFIGLGIYIFSYYSWCSYMVKGILPFDLQDAVRSAREKFETAREHPGMVIKAPEIPLNVKMPSKYQIGMNMILLAVVLFTVTWFGYAIQHGLIPRISWEFMGLGNFVWSASYTYILSFFGILLILSGLKFLKKIEI